MVFVILLLTTFVLVYFLNQYFLSYWSRNGFKQLKPSILFGDAYSMLTMKYGVGQYFEKLYEENKNKKIFGVYVSYKRLLVVTDPKVLFVNSSGNVCGANNH